MNGECPKDLGGAQVVAYAIVGRGNARTGNTEQIVAGKSMGSACAMIIAQQPGNPGYYVFASYSEEWSAETDTWHDDLESAIEQLDWEYVNLSKNLVWVERPNNNS